MSSMDPRAVDSGKELVHVYTCGIPTGISSLAAVQSTKLRMVDRFSFQEAGYPFQHIVPFMRRFLGVA